MKRSKKMIAWTAALAVAAASPAGADHDDHHDHHDTVLVVLPAGQSDALELPRALLLADDHPPAGQLVVASRPVHGTLTKAADGFRYQAGSSFWVVGSDSFALATGLEGGGSSWMVAIAAGVTHLGAPALNDLEQPSAAGHPDWQATGDSAAIVPEAAIFGQRGLRTFPEQSGDGYLSFGPGDDPDTPGDTAPFDDAGSGTHTTIVIRPPDPPADHPRGGGEADPPGGGQVIYAAHDADGERTLALWLQAGEQAWQTRLEVADDDGQPHLGRWTDLPAGPPWQLRVEYDQLPAFSDAARLLINGDLASEVLDFEAEAPVVEHRFGIMDRTGGGLTLDLDNLYLRAYAIHARDEPSHMDAFEGAFAEGWDLGRAGDLGLTEARTTSGRFAQLHADLGATAGNSYLLDTSPDDAPRALIRFDLDPSQLAAETVVRLLGGLRSEVVAGAHEHLKVWAAHRQDRFELRLSLRDDQGQSHLSGWLPLAAASNRVEIALRTGVDDGALRLWLEGVEQTPGGMSGLDNDANPLDAVRLGAIAITGGGGDLYLDNYQLWVPHPPVAPPGGPVVLAVSDPEP